MEQGNGSGSASSNSVGMISTKCGANMSPNDQDCTILSQEDFSSQKKEPLVKKQKVLTSTVWEHFDRIKTETKEGTSKIEAICKYCRGNFNGASHNGTSSNLAEHTRKSELDEYLKEGLFPMDNGVEFDILNWWKLNGPKFPILARMARDILAIPTSSVASENSFSKCRRIITDTRSSLHSESVETLMCVKDWLPDIEDGHSEKDVENDSSVPFDSSYGDWDLDF